MPSNSDIGSMDMDIDSINNKRKGSPLSKDDAKKNTGGLVRSSSLQNIASRASSKEKGTSKIAFSDMIKMSFNDQGFAKSMAPILYDMVSPLIQSTVNQAINQIKLTVVDEMIKSNNELKEMVTQQSETIKAQKVVIEDQKQLLAEKAEKIENLEFNVDYLMAEVDSMKIQMNNLEQYGRRNSIRINNFKVPAPPADELELTKHVVSFLNKRILHDTKPSDLRDVERCHFVGKAVFGRSRQIIVKFCHYQDKKRVFAGKSKLKGHPAKIFLTEDLTSVNHSVVKSLLPLKKNDSIDSFWTSNGQIYVKKDSTSAPVKVSSTDDLNSRLSLTDGDATTDDSEDPSSFSVFTS